MTSTPSVCLGGPGPWVRRLAQAASGASHRVRPQYAHARFHQKCCIQASATAATNRSATDTRPAPQNPALPGQVSNLGGGVQVPSQTSYNRLNWRGGCQGSGRSWDDGVGDRGTPSL